MVLCIVLFALVMGRVAAMWIAAEVNRHNEPILYKVVKDRDNAARYIDEIIRIEGLQVEILGHIVLNGIHVLTRNSLFAWHTYIGLMAKPFDLVAVASKSSPTSSITGQGDLETKGGFVPYVNSDDIEAAVPR